MKKKCTRGTQDAPVSRVFHLTRDFPFIVCLLHLFFLPSTTTFHQKPKDHKNHHLHSGAGGTIRFWDENGGLETHMVLFSFFFFFSFILLLIFITGKQLLRGP